MPIQVKDRPDHPHCEGKNWYVRDEDTLVKHLAYLVVGQHRHVSRILRKLGGSAVQIQLTEVDVAERKLKVLPGAPTYHRDGWLFQLISWIVLVERLGSKGYVDAPHPIQAQKGIDTLGFSIKGKDPKGVGEVFVGEEKATDHPRKTFKNDVISEFEAIARGERNSEIRSRLSTIIDTIGVAEDQKKKLIEQGIWTRNFCYRCCIGTTTSSLPSKTSVFDGFAKALGKKSKRLGELLLQDDFRMYLDTLAGKVLDYIRNEITVSDNV